MNAEEKPRKRTRIACMAACRDRLGGPEHQGDHCVHYSMVSEEVGFEMESQRQEGASHLGSREPLPSSPRRLRVCPATLLGTDGPRTTLLTVTVHSWRGGGERRGRLWPSRAAAEKDRLAPPQACEGMAGFNLTLLETAPLPPGQIDPAWPGPGALMPIYS